MSEIVPFDYSQLNEVAQGALRDLAERLGRLAQDTAVGLWQMGSLLSDAQEKLAAYGTGTFQRWVANETTLGLRTVYRLINVHRTFDCATLAQTTFATTALYLLAESSTPPEARTEAVRQAQEGKPITPERAREIVQTYQPPPPPPDVDRPEPPEYREFEREELLPRLHDAGVEGAPQLLSGKREELPLAPEELEERATGSLREAILGVLASCLDGECVDTCADELLEIMGQSSGSIALAAHFGIALTRGPLSLLDLTEIACKSQGTRLSDLEREERLILRKRVLRLIDSLTYSGLGLYEHTLENKQLVYSLLSCDA